MNACRYCLLLLFAVHASLCSAATPYIGGFGDRAHQEKGDALYRMGYASNRLSDTEINPYGHTGVYCNYISTKGSPGTKTAHAITETTGGQGVKYVDFTRTGFMTEEYYGSYSVSPTLTYQQRQDIKDKADSLHGKNIGWCWIDQVIYDGYDHTNPVDIQELRCDGVVEWCYEVNGIKVWWPKANPDHWSVIAYPSDHNNFGNDVEDDEVIPDIVRCQRQWHRSVHF